MKVFVVYDSTMEEIVRIFDDEDAANHFCCKYKSHTGSKYVYVQDYDLISSKLDFNVKRKFELSESMEISLVTTASDLACSEDDLLEAILVAFFWHNFDLLKFLYSKEK